ncbi:MAG TPA: TadE family type IV pilus minor pilin [Motilibacteraceae bacterium]|nr:TadE family type IV pilus minor pilin [Motilibacteraceae bacterium]
MSGADVVGSPAGSGAARARVLSQRGSATAETALLLPGLVALLAFLLSALAAGGVQLRCLDAARAGARVAARGESAQAVAAAALAVVPAASVSTGTSGSGLLQVRVTRQVRVPGLGRWWAWTVGSTAVAAAEAGAGVGG